MPDRVGPGLPPSADDPTNSPSQPKWRRPRTSTLGALAFTAALFGFLLGWFPYAGFLGTLGLLLAVIDCARPNPDGQRSTGLSIAGIILGAISTVAAIWWTQFLAHAHSCPHVYSWTGKAFELDADPLSGSLLRGGETTDLDRLEHLAAVDGQYRIRVVDELEEVDHINEVALLVADHPAGSESLPTPAGDVLAVRAAVPPVAATDGRGRDVLPVVGQADGSGFTGRAEDFAPDAPTDPREHLDLVFPRPTGGGRAVLVLRARCTKLATEAFAEYLMRMGEGALVLLSWTQDCKDYPYARRMADEIRRLGLPLDVSLRDGGRWVGVAEVRPIGPGVLRSVAIPLEVPAGPDPTVRVRLELAPLLWEIDQVGLGCATTGPVAVMTLRPRAARAARGADGQDLVRALAAPDDERVTLAPGQSCEVAFDAPPAPPPGLVRTVLLQIRGYYEVEIHGPGWLDPLAVLRHRSGSDSLPRFALRRARTAAGVTRSAGPAEPAH